MNFQHKAYSIIPVFFSVVIGLSCGLSAPLSAEEKPAKKIPTQSELPWEHSAAAGFSFASGNSDSVSYNLRFLSTFRTDDADAFIGADYFYSRDFGQDTNNTLQVRGAYDRLISKRFYLGLNASLLTNEASDIDYRLDLSPVLGYYFIRNERGLLSAAPSASHNTSTTVGMRSLGSVNQPLSLLAQMMPLARSLNSLLVSI